MYRPYRSAIVLATVVFLSSLFAGTVEGTTAFSENITITIDADSEQGELYDFWNVSPETVQAPFKDKTLYEKLHQRLPYAKYINCVRFLGGINLEKDDYFRGVDAQGGAICDFTEGIALPMLLRRW